MVILILRETGDIKDYVVAMWLILFSKKWLKDYVLLTGVTTKVRDFISIGFFDHIGFEISWSGSALRK